MITVNGYEPTIVTFPNKEITLSLPEEAFIEKEAVILWKFEDNNDFFKLRLLKSYLQENKQFTYTRCHILYMPYSRMDRVQDKNPFSLRECISILPREWSYVVYEPHSDVTKELFEENELELEIVYTSQFLLDAFLSVNDSKDYVLVLPDKGAFTRYIKNDILKLEKPMTVLYAEKERDFKTGEILGLSFDDSSIPDNEFKAVILDDLSSYGGTFIRTVEALKAKGCTGVSLITAHAEDSIYRGKLLTHLESYFTTDSILTFTANTDVLTVLSMNNIVEETEAKLKQKK